MKTSFFYKFKAFPYASARKIALYQQWNPLRKISRENKRMFRGRNRIFSMDSNRPLPKEVLLKMVTSVKNGYSNTFKLDNKSNPQLNKPGLLQTYGFSKIFKKNHKTNQSSNMSYYCVNSLRKAYNLHIFRSIFLRKMWMLYNPSLVPGITRPFKFKKSNVVKIKALKAFNSLIGDCNLKFIDFILKKSWNMSKNHNSIPFYWNLPRTVDSLKGITLLKIGLVFTIPITAAFISRKQLSVNGFTSTKIQNLLYPGDYLKFNLQSFFTQNNVNIFENSPINKHLNLPNKFIRTAYYKKRQKFQKPPFLKQ